MKPSVTDILVKVVASALSDFPRLNAHVQADRLIIKKSINVGVAVSVHDGLIVPVVPLPGDLQTPAAVSNCARS